MSVTYHMGSHSVRTLTFKQIGLYSIYLLRRDGRLSSPTHVVACRSGLSARTQSPILVIFHW